MLNFDSALSVFMRVNGTERKNGLFLGFGTPSGEGSIKVRSGIGAVIGIFETRKPPHPTGDRAKSGEVPPKLHEKHWNKRMEGS